ncbi:hypothetical protein DICPUDRAFT_77002 [Dictyostelium purpureum]|uniref:Uncharacterized protein n=1 Tax=Dictyostelium purpureum TaxID=5786 RepID=F0ZFB1_DICPU|nr:uncharacterized protein DICPUDRAFT_77002 [Dictyostelium purpureum]EGC37354.1 hypothetical protein DICPUDRAFT_77002 [Dictyostelium purpureum]|eukprot:XP_003286095.1 hypothetical protein DICPUDRAFT_77002 [Dictyostelium purpureum]
MSFADFQNLLVFKESFSDWGGSLPIAMQQAPVGVNTASAKKQEKIDVATMHKPKPEKEEVMIDDGSGKLTIWRFEEFQKFAIDPKNYGADEISINFIHNYLF